MIKIDYKVDKEIDYKVHMEMQRTKNQISLKSKVREFVLQMPIIKAMGTSKVGKNRIQSDKQTNEAHCKVQKETYTGTTDL